MTPSAANHLLISNSAYSRDKTTIQIENCTEAVREFDDEEHDLTRELGFDSENLQQKYYISSRSSTTKLQ